MKGPARRLRFSVVAVLAAIAACVTVNIYFPAAKVEKTAERIVGEVYQGKTPPREQTPPQEQAPPREQAPPGQAPEEKPRSSNEDGVSGPSWLARIGPAPACAQEEATTVSNAAIRALKDQIAQRHGELLPYYQGGQVGINRDGYLETRDTGGLNLAQVAALKRLVDADNAARRRLYDEVARALDLKPEQVPQIQRIFAKQWRDQAQGGWWIQTDDGRWARK